MGYVLTNSEMRNADKYTIESVGVPSLALMERAGEALANEAENLGPAGKILCVCGGGNNGGDGFVCARLLRARGRAVDVVFYAEKVSLDCRTNMEKWRLAGGKILTEIPKGYAVIVDCLYGTGFRGCLAEKDLDSVLKINAQKQTGAKILSADIPSGLCGDNGIAVGVCVHADVTLCIGEKKTGVLLQDGLDMCGEVKQADIGIVLPEGNYAKESDVTSMQTLLPKRNRNTHKGSFGKAAIIGGGMQYTGAAYLSAAACLRSGAGYTTLFTPSNCLPYYVLKSPEILLKSSNDGDRYAFNEKIMQSVMEYDAVAYGMGMGVSDEVLKGVVYLLKNYQGKLIVDADGINSLALLQEEELKNLLENKRCDVLLTPHVKEFSRLTKLSVEEIVNNAIEIPKRFAKSYSVGILLKSASTVITDGETVWINTTGNSGQAKGGSGDVLSGLIAGLSAMGTSAFAGGVLGAWLAGKAAECAQAECGEYAMLPTDVISYFGKAFLSLT